MKKIIVLDGENQITHIFDFDDQVFDEEEIEVFFQEVHMAFGMPLKESECSWMVVEQVKIEMH